MKKHILFGLLTAFLAATTPLRAQVDPRDADPRKGSRLEMGRTSTGQKTAPSSLPTKRFSRITPPVATTLDRAGVVRKNTPINEYYRSLLVARPAAKSSGRTTTTDVGTVAVGETRALQEAEIKADDRLYSSDRITVSNIYPNPASEAAHVDYQFTGPVSEAKLILLNVLGSPVAEYDMERSDRKVSIATRDLTTGYYFYQLSLDGKKVATKKLLVRHQ